MRGMALCFPAVDENFWITPPRARGRQNALTVSRRVVRITPACAGKTDPNRPEPAVSRDHPRMRGEDADAIAGRAGKGGSPPHARGRPGFGGEGTVAPGLTPACAGKTCSLSGRLWP